jgi:hypothetical protein
MKSFLFYLILVLILPGCSLFHASSSKGTVLYEGKISTGEDVRIIYSDNTVENLCRIYLYNKEKLIDEMEIYNVPQRFLIDKDVLPRKTNSRVFRMVSDTTSNLLRCINYNFPQELCNPQTRSTFIPITTRDQEVFTMTSRALSETNYKIKMSISEVERMIGWVVIKP